MDIQIVATGSKGNCYIVSDGYTKIMIDAGIRFKKIQEAINFELSSISAVLLTHEHLDHAKSIKDIAERGRKVYTSQGTKEALGLPHELPIEAAANLQTIEVGTLLVKPFNVEHDAAEPFGFLIFSSKTGKKLLFATDTYYIRYRFKGLTHVMVECNYSQETLNYNTLSGQVNVSLARRIMESHFSLENVIDFLQSSTTYGVLEEVYLIHASSINADKQHFKNQIQQLTGAAVYVP